MFFLQFPLIFGAKYSKISDEISKAFLLFPIDAACAALLFFILNRKDFLHMSSKLYQGMIQQMKDCTDRVIGVTDDAASIVACSDLSMVGQSVGMKASDIMAMSEVSTYNGYTYTAIGSRVKLEKLVFVSGTDQFAQTLCGILAASLGAINEFYDEKYDKANFIKNNIREYFARGYIRQGQGATFQRRCVQSGNSHKIA